MMEPQDSCARNAISITPTKKTRANPDYSMIENTLAAFMPDKEIDDMEFCLRVGIKKTLREIWKDCTEFYCFSEIPFDYTTKTFI
jgi:hypothetical protein